MNRAKIFEDLIQTVERNAVNNQATITNVELWAKSWREELRQYDCYKKLPPNFDVLESLLPVAKRELAAIHKRYKYEPVVLTRFVQKLEEYMAAISS